MPLYDLTGDPFAGIIVTKEKDLKNELTVKTRSIRELEDIFIYGFALDAPKHYILLGGSGVGKSTALYHLKRYIQDNAPKDSYITHVHRGGSFTIPRDLKAVFGEKDPRDKGQRLLMARYDWTNWQDALKQLAGGKQIYLFWDFPDKIAQGQELKATLQGMEELIRQDGVHVFIAMNKNNYDVMLKASNLPGKFRKVELKRFDAGETHELLYKRLSYYRAPESSYKDVEPFNDVVGALRDAGGGVPRTILTTADLVLKGAHERGIRELRVQDVKEILHNAEYRRRIIEDRVDDRNKADTLYLLVEIIRDEFGGHIRKQRELIEHMREKHGWSNVTTIKRLKILQDYGLIETRTGDDFWTKTYTLI